MTSTGVQDDERRMRRGRVVRRAGVFRRERISRRAQIAAAGLVMGGILLVEPLRAQTVAEICSGGLTLFPIPEFEAFDINDDGWLDETEVGGCDTLNFVFQALDLDANDRLSRPEYASFRAVWSRAARTFPDDVSE